MIPWELLDKAAIPGGGELRFLRRGDEFSIRQGHTELMNSRAGFSEQELARLTCERLGARPGLRLLIGGLGMGFTLRAALASLGRDAHVTVAELVPEVVRWAQGPMAHLFAGSLSDRRVELVTADVGEIIRRSRAAYDAILLDVDNGPDALERPENERIYQAAGLSAAGAALRPAGLLAVWSAAEDNGFVRRLQRSGFQVEQVRIQGRGARHVIWFATSALPPRGNPPSEIRAKRSAAPRQRRAATERPGRD
jgi:spermidine synthase